MKALVVLFLLESLDLAWCCILLPWAVNIAEFGQVSQSSTFFYGSVISTADKAVDGVTDQDWNHNSCTHTNQDNEAWWRLDMKQSHKIEIVVVYGRTDSWMGRLMGAEVRIGNFSDNNNPVCGKISDTSKPTTFCCDGMEGRYVSVVIPGHGEFLSLCEVEVYDDSMYETC
ncbi:fucolectin-1-like [Mantella aurantiaca]